MYISPIVLPIVLNINLSLIKRFMNIELVEMPYIDLEIILRQAQCPFPKESY